MSPRLPHLHSLEGLPLAIELAAAWERALGVEEIARGWPTASTCS